MQLQLLLHEALGTTTGGLPQVDIRALTADSRQVTPGALFVAVRGGTADGHQFLGEAVRRGAAALVGEAPQAELGAPYVRVADSRLALAQLAAAWHGRPARRLVMIGVTGTDGKTTTTSMIYHILMQAGFKVAMISTVHAIVAGRTLDTGLHVTTPDPLEVQALLAEVVRAGITHTVLEATSHGLAQHRVAGCEFDVGVVTNITHEHLDYHGSYESYRHSKGLLFSGLSETTEKPGSPTRTAVLNLDDSSYGYLRGVTRVRQVSYGLGKGADVRAVRVHCDAQGLRFAARGKGYQQEIRSPLLGVYNVPNALAAFAATVEALGIGPAVAAAGIAGTPGVPGRMEVIDLGQPFTAIVDFAHTPNALRVALETARGLTDKRVIAVFGSAGLRDRAKRRMMAEVSAGLADLTVLTAEDPRTEPLIGILEEMAAGARSKGGVEGKTFWRIPDRGEAIRFAVCTARPGDLVISCGKGHEQSMCFETTEHPWDDRVAMRAALAELVGVAGPAMPRLPTSPG